MKLLSLQLVLVSSLIFCFSTIIIAYPQPVNNPDAEYELISGGPQVGPKPIFMPMTQKPLTINTPPPAPANSKNFAFDPIAKTWTQVKKGDPPPSEDTLIWNQSNDKWLTI